MAPKSKAPCYVLGVGMTKFIKPRGKVDYTELGFEAGVKALLDAHVNYDDIEAAVACYCYGDSTCGQRVIYQLGMSQIPVYNVNNNCSSLQTYFNDRPNPTGTFGEMMKVTRGVTNAPGAAQMFGNAGRQYKEEFGATNEDFAEIGRINHEHSKRNPYSQFQDEYTLEQVMNAPMIHEPLTKLQCCPTSDGGAAAVLVSQEFLDARPHLKDQAILVAGQCLATDSPALFSRSAMDLVGYEMSKYAARVALTEAKVDVKDVKVCELHDCFSANEMCVIDALGLCEHGKAHEMVRKGDITYGGKMVINPSGGLISKGHPLGATGIAQCAELCWHLRGWANNRLVKGTNAALQHNLGLGGAVVVTVYKRADGQESKPVSSEEVAKKTGLGYNPAVEAKGFTKSQADSVRSKKSRSDWAAQDVESKVQARF